jgi:hypothetical protein
LLCEDAVEMIDLPSQAMGDAAKEAAVLLYSPGTDTFLENPTRNAASVFYFDEGPRAARSLFRKPIPGLRRARGLWRHGHDSMATQMRGQAP